MGGIEVISYDGASPKVLGNIEKLNKSGRYKDFWLGYFDNVFVPKNYPSQSGATVKIRPQFIVHDKIEMIFAAFQVPQGSAVFTPKTGKREDGIRGVLLFIKNGYSYQLHNESVNALNLNPSDQDVKSGVISLYDRIKFH